MRCGNSHSWGVQIGQRVFSLDWSRQFIVFFFAECRNLHQRKLDKQSLRRRSSQLRVRLGQERNGSKEECRFADCRLLTILFEQRARVLYQRDGRALGNQQIAEMLIQSAHKYLSREALRQHRVVLQQRIYIVATQEQLGETEIGFVVENIQRCSYGMVLQLCTAERHRLIEHRQRITHSAVSLLRYKVQRLVIRLDALVLCNVAQVTHRILHSDTIEVVYLATRENRWDNLVLLGGSEDKDCMLRWLLQSFQEGIERRRREHVNLIDDEYRVLTNLRQHSYLLDKIADILHRVVRCGIQLMDIERAVFVERTARVALVARLGTYGVLTVYRLGEDSRTGCLTHTAGSAE